MPLRLFFIDLSNKKIFFCKYFFSISLFLIRWFLAKFSEGILKSFVFKPLLFLRIFASFKRVFYEGAEKRMRAGRL